MLLVVDKKMSIWFISMLIIVCLMVTGCNEPTPSKNQIKVGTITGPDTELMKVAQVVAKKRYNLEIKIVEFSDYAMPNTALNDGSIDANMFQHIPYFEEAKKARHYDLTMIGKTFIFPMGLYSEKIHTIDQVSEGATIAVPNDPTNETRALLLLQKTGLITLKPGVGLDLNSMSIENNPKKLVIKPLNAAQLPRVLPDVVLAAITNTYAIPAGLNPKKDALFLEGADSIYANIVVIRTKDKNDPRFQQLLQALHSPEVLVKAKELFNDQAIPAWEVTK